MAKFAYSGRDRRGPKKGTLTAKSKKEAIEKLQSSGIRVKEIIQKEEAFWEQDIVIGRAVKLEHMVIFLRQFAALLQAGVTVVDSAFILSQQTDSKPLKRALANMETEMREGRPLSDAAEKQKKIFEPLFINMLKAGEATGTLDQTFNDLAIHYERQHRTRQKVISALAYPIVVGIVAVFVVIFLLVSVVPTFVGMFEDFGGELPAITQFVINASEWMQRFWYVIALLAGLLFGAIWMLRQRPETKMYIDYAVLRMPIFGNLMQKAVLARMTRTLSSLFSNSVPILRAMDITSEVVENEVIASVIRDSKRSLERGESITGPMQRHWAFPPLLHQMVAIGEETGSLDQMLSKVADFYEAEVETVTDRLKALIEPLMIVLLAGIVGTIVISIMVPMFEIFNTVQENG
ncbi:type II secretion system F family protein [Domibacillus enclensis]|uniref:Type II secretion system protein F n=1 Tax=Domibacillus enclensis TaxID=1017273 RepID=A0A1N6Q0F4_9BACI|nr:type II secretion system F family protein [Domibacillus enclensis]OXS80543.1 type II secretion system protein F [Domibacillus enclensis]SIQ10061.1 type IV pilus assembly protein PilC [Domibacillus enclensis]